MKTITRHRQPLRREINKIIAAGHAQATQPGAKASWQADFLSRLATYATTGKLLRGCLLCFSFQTFSGGRPTKSVIQAAAALELIHSALLIHDDIMDGDDFRRGQPAMHEQYAAIGRRRKLTEPERFGANMAICGADTAIFIAQGVLSEQPEAVNKLFASILAAVCEGQMQDVYHQSAHGSPSKQAIYGLMNAKTASYTLSLPLAAGAILAQQAPSVTDKLQRVGEAAGTIFQIRDDELGVLGDTAKTGKPAGADIREGKKTLIHYYLIKKCNESELRKLRGIFGNQDVSDKDIVYVLGLIDKYEISRLLALDVRRLESEALKIITSLSLDAHSTAEMESLVKFCTQRQS